MTARASTAHTPARMSFVLTGALRTRSSRGRRLILIMSLVSGLPQGQPNAHSELRGNDLQVLRVELLRIGLDVLKWIGHLAGNLEVFGEILHQAGQARAAPAQENPVDRVAVRG